MNLRNMVNEEWCCLLLGDQMRLGRNICYLKVSQGMKAG
jgi:hypothetical protein